MADQETINNFLHPKDVIAPATFSFDENPVQNHTPLPGTQNLDVPPTALPVLPGLQPGANNPVKIPVSWQDYARINALILELFDKEGLEAAQKLEDFVKAELNS